MINFLSRKLKTDAHYLVHGTFWLVTQKIFSALGFFITAVFFANFVSPEIYGSYKFLLSLAGIAGAFSLTGLNTYLIRASANNLDGELTNSFRLFLKSSLVSLCVFSLFSAYYFFNGNVTYGFALLLLSVPSLLTRSAQLSSAFLQGKGRFKDMFRFSIVNDLLNLLFIGACIFFFPERLLFLLGAYLAGSLLSAFITYFFSLKITRNSLSDPKKSRFSIHLSIMNVFETLATQIDRILLFHFFGPAQLAAYSFALLPVEQLRNFSKIMRTLSLPKLSRHKTVQMMKKSTNSRLMIVFLVAFFIMLFYILLAPLLFNLLFPTYASHIHLSQFLALGLIAIPNVFITQFMAAADRSGDLYIFKILGGSSRLLFMIVFIPLFGLWGAAYAFVSAHITQLLIALILLFRAR